MNLKEIEIFKHNATKEIAVFYLENRKAFLQFGKQYNLDYDDLADIYQEAFIVLRQKAIHGKLDTVKSSLKTYLFGIGKHMIFDYIREKKKVTLNHESILKNASEIPLIEPVLLQNELTLEQQLLKRTFKKLGIKCQEVLTLFYARGLTLDEIVSTTSYTSNSVVRSQKSRCIKKLKEMIKSEQ